MGVRYIVSLIGLGLLVVILSVFFFGCRNGSAFKTGSSGPGPKFFQNVGIKDLPALSNQEKQDLLFMRQEEKLARDVYTELSKRWNLPRLSRIVESEQRHMDAIKRLLDLYHLQDPVKQDEVGEFSSSHFSKLYRELTAQGNRSIVDALKVGATIEDLDIKDLQECLNHTHNPLIAQTYENLLRGSRNHMRYFISELTTRNEGYEPKYISRQEFDQIVSTPLERGRGGKCPAGGRGQGPRGRGRGPSL